MVVKRKHVHSYKLVDTQFQFSVAVMKKMCTKYDSCTLVKDVASCPELGLTEIKAARFFFYKLTSRTPTKTEERARMLSINAGI